MRGGLRGEIEMEGNSRLGGGAGAGFGSGISRVFIGVASSRAAGVSHTIVTLGHFERDDFVFVGGRRDRESGECIREPRINATNYRGDDNRKDNAFPRVHVTRVRAARRGFLQREKQSSRNHG
jgi:hypothetical protein